MLEKLKIPFKIFKPNVDETPLPKEEPESLVKRISLLKAEEAYKIYKKDLIIAADTILYARKKFFHKTEDREQAYNYLKLLSGKRHTIFTGLTIIDSNYKKYFYLTKTKIKFKVLNQNDINKYLILDEWKNKTGCYAVQGYGAIFINFLAGSFSGAIGLPLEKLHHVLREKKIL